MFALFNLSEILVHIETLTPTTWSPVYPLITQANGFDLEHLHDFKSGCPVKIYFAMPQRSYGEPGKRKQKQKRKTL